MNIDAEYRSNDVEYRASMLILEIEIDQHLLVLRDFLGAGVPSTHVEAAILNETDLEVKHAANKIAHRAKEASACLGDLQRISDKISLLENTSDSKIIGDENVENMRRSVEIALNDVNNFIKKIHLDLWNGLPPEKSMGFAEFLIRRLNILSRDTVNALDRKNAVQASLEWQLAARAVEWWSCLVPEPFRQAGFVKETHLTKPYNAYLAQSFIFNNN